MTICAITGFCGRARNVERIIRHYIDQDYTGQSYLLLYNNSPKRGQNLKLSDISLPENKAIILVNNNIDLQTGKEYTNTGDIFRDALEYVPLGTEIVTFFDSDDSFMPQHLSSGVEGMKKAYQLGCLAYKPYYSYFLYENRVELMHNTLEPSIFADYQYVKEQGFHPQTCTYHQKWLDLLGERKQLFVDPDGPSTLIYNWQEGHGNHKISGLGDSEFNFEAHRKWETDYGDYGENGVLSPCPELEAQYFYRLAKRARLPTT